MQVTKFQRISAAIQVVIVLLIIGYGTYQLFRGNFEQAMTMVPFMVIYYFFLLARGRKNKIVEDDKD